ncbi:MAG: SDR family NAD(P)-dependent oxidoreductase [Thiotrichales bacterium]|nr:MAG: SDR family NAD(P)-dependent oxidoreductase [Thiotrichales bacterium]
MNTGPSAIIIGASSRIGTALRRQWQKDDGIDNIIAISRQHLGADDPGPDSKVHFIRTDYDEQSIARTCERIKMLTRSVSRVCICNGILHNEDMWPEKRIEELNIDTLRNLFTINSVIPVLWLKALLPLVKSKDDCVISVFSARIGSIDDNRSGGWYSYRASKAALNMLLKTAAIEYARRAANVKLMAFHPGTTDTPLSKPFQRSVKKENLFTPEYVAEHLVNLMNSQTADGECSFIDWENKAIAW